MYSQVEIIYWVHLINSDEALPQYSFRSRLNLEESGPLSFPLSYLSAYSSFNFLVVGVAETDGGEGTSTRIPTLTLS